MMKQTKKGIAFITIFCMVVTLSIPVNAKAASISDSSDHWANATIQSWIEKDFISGYPDGSFKPENDIKRAEFMTLVNKAFKFTSQAAISFSDVTPDAWYFSTVKEALAAGYISGYSDGTMRPDNPITREEVATIIFKIKMLEENTDGANNFSDVMRLTWSKGAIGAIAKANIMHGYPDGSFMPQNYIKRGEAVVSLDRASKYFNMPPAPSVIGNDEKDTVTGLTSTMEYKLDSLDWVTYDATTFKKLNFGGNHTLLVRFFATDSIPFSQTTTLTFTEGVPSVGSRSSSDSSPTPNPVVTSVTGVTLDKNAITLTAGGLTAAIMAIISPSNATNKTVTWMSSNINVATVSGGAVTSVASGTAIITTTTVDGGKIATCTVTVNPAPVPVIGVTLDRTVLTLTSGGVTDAITATVSPTNATNKTVNWMSSNINVATVSGGVITSVASGTAIITAITADGGKIATCTVTVTDSVTNPTVIFSRAKLTEESTYFAELGYPNADVDKILRVLWGEPEEPLAATIAGVYVESGVFSTSGTALVINADKITQSLLDWFHHGIWTDGRMAIEIKSSNDQGFLEGNPENSNIENTSGSPVLGLLTVNFKDWSGTSIRVDLDNIEIGSNSGTILMNDGITKADFQIITIGNLIHATSISITSSSLTISFNDGELQMNAVVLPEGAYNKSIKWVVDDGNPYDMNEIARISNSLYLPGNVYALKNGTVTVTAISRDDPSIVSNPLVVTITGQVGPATPSGIVITNESVYGAKDGILTGVESGQEYQLIGAVSWTAITGKTVTGLTPGAYTVRVAETETGPSPNPPSAPAGFQTEPLVIEAAPFVPADAELQQKQETETESLLNSEPLTQFEPELESELQLEPEITL